MAAENVEQSTSETHGLCVLIEMELQSNQFHEEPVIDDLARSGHKHYMRCFIARTQLRCPSQRHQLTVMDLAQDESSLDDLLPSSLKSHSGSTSSRTNHHP